MKHYTQTCPHYFTSKNDKMEGKMNDITNLIPSTLESQLMNYSVSEVYLDRLIQDIKPEWLLNEFHNSLFEILSEYYLTSGRMPNGEIVALQFKKIFEDHECTKAYQIYLSLLNHKNELHDNQYTIAKNAVESNWIECNLREAMQESISEMNAKNGQQALEILEKNVERLRYNTSDTKIIDYDIGDFASFALDRYDQEFKTEELIGTGVDVIDERMGGGFRKPNVVALGCGTQGGKSIIAMNLGYNAYKQGLNVAYVTIEMSEEEFLARLHSRISQIPATPILMRTLTEEQKLNLRQSVMLDTVNPKYLKEAQEYIDDLKDDLLKFTKDDMDKNFFESDFYIKRPNTYYPIDIPSGCKLEIIRSKIIKLKEQRGCDMVIIDYAGIMEEILKGEQSWQSYSNLWLRLKALARELDIVLVSPVQAHDDGHLKYATAVRDHIDIGLNWMRSDEDILNDRVQFWFTKLRHGKAQYSDHEESLVFDFTSSEEQTASDLSIKNPIYATLDTDVMTLKNYDNPDEGEFVTI